MLSWLTGSSKERDNTKAGTEITRRGFLKYTATGITGITLLALSFREMLTADETPLTPMETLSHLKKSDFSQHLGENFSVYRSELDKIDVKLIEVANSRYDASNQDEESFTLLFQGYQDEPLKQDTYRIENSVMGTFPLFIVPVYSEDTDLRYEVIFNRQLA